MQIRPPYTVLHIITDLADGGAQAVLYELCKALHGDVRMVVVALADHDKYQPLLANLGIEVHCLGMRPDRVSVSAIWRLYRLVNKVRPDVVQTWMYHADLLGGVVARVLGVKQIVWGVRHSGLGRESISRTTRLVVTLCAKLSRLIPNSIIVCAEGAKTSHMGAGYACNKMYVVPNGYDVNRFFQDASLRSHLRSEMRIGTGVFLVGLVGRWNPQKDHANLLAAFHLASVTNANSQLLLVGTACSPDNAQLVQLIEQAGLTGRVHLMGRRDDVPAIMNALDLHVLSSYSEAFPNVVAEAMACGTPCVVTDVGDAALIVDDTGWVVPPRNSMALAEAICAAIDESKDAERWTKLQHDARQRIVDNFSLETMVMQYKAVWSGRAPSEALADTNPPGQ